MALAPKSLYTICNDTTISGSVTFRKGSMITCEGVDLFKEINGGGTTSQPQPPNPQTRLLLTEDEKLILTEDDRTILI